MKKNLLTVIAILGFATVSMARSSSKECDKLVESKKQTETNIKFAVQLGIASLIMEVIFNTSTKNISIRM